MTIELRAPAKLTLTLHVIGVRDDGYHLLEALVVMVDAPADRVLLDERPSGIEVVVTGAGEGVPADSTNLAARAAAAVLPPDRGVRITLDKAIPPGAGLGGGSSDAAAVLRGLRDHFGVRADRVAEVAAKLGADVPVCVHGGPAWMRGIGEVVVPVTLDGGFDLVVATPPFGCATEVVYGAWDELDGPRNARRVLPPPAVAHLVPALENHLEYAAEEVEPRLGPFRGLVESVAGAPALLAGSGASYVVPMPDPERAAAVAAQLREHAGVRAWAGRAPASI